MSRRTWLCGVLATLLLAGGLRGAWLTADPPVNPVGGDQIASVAPDMATEEAVGIVWHDEGAWVHNARNKAMWGYWRTDAWNPMFIAPVFTALETVAFELVGVGTWQARTVPLASGLVAILALMWGLSGVAGRRAALFGGLLLATSYTSVMWNRAALMESTMTMFIVVGWAAYARAQHHPRWGLLAGAAVVLAFFTKAAAVFFVGALAVELALAWWAQSPGSRVLRWTVLGMTVTGAVALLLFVIPNWSEFKFYNFQMTVTRKTVYTLEAFQDRISWLPLAHGVFTRMWLVLLVASVAAIGIVARWRASHPAERLAVLWLMVGLLELVLHDSGNERRYVMFVPAVVAVASMAIGAANQPPPRLRGSVGFSLAVAAILGYLVIASGLRLVWIDDVLAGDYSLTVRASAAVAVLLAAALWWRWRTWEATVIGWRIPVPAAVVMVVITCGIDLTLYAQWARQRTFHNYYASRALAGVLPAGTRVHGKLANGLALENAIMPIFVGRGFGNYADRLERADARYILTYTQPRLGYEGSVILDVLQHYPGQRVIVEFDVDETPGPDRAALIDKFPGGPEPRARNQ